MKRDPLPKATIRVECQQTNPPKPIGCAIFVDDKMIAVVTIASLKEAAKTVADLEEARAK